MVKRISVFMGVGMIYIFLNACESAAPTAPVIKQQGATWTVELSKNIQQAIRKFDPDFRPWQFQDYSPRIRNSYEKSDAKESRFALIVDANNDGTLDVIIDGHDKKRDLLIGAVSDRGRYKIYIIREANLSDPATIENWNDLSSSLANAAPSSGSPERASEANGIPSAEGATAGDRREGVYGRAMMMRKRPRIRPRIHEWMTVGSCIREKFVDGFWTRPASLSVHVFGWLQVKR